MRFRNTEVNTYIDVYTRESFTDIFFRSKGEEPGDFTAARLSILNPDTNTHLTVVVNEVQQFYLHGRTEECIFIIRFGTDDQDTGYSLLCKTIQRRHLSVDLDGESSFRSVEF